MTSANSIRDTFFEECEELLEALAEGLSLMEANEHDAETVNAVFRAVHSIKGGAGAFALKELVGFAHRFETVLDLLRAGKIELGSDVMRTLLRSADHLADHVEAAREEREVDPSITDGFIQQLNLWLDEDTSAPGPAEDDDPFFGFAAVPLSIDEGPMDPQTAHSPATLLPDLPGPDLRAATSDEATTRYRITFSPLPELFANGHEPALIFAALQELGSLSVEADCRAMPSWEDVTTEDLWLGWTITLQTAAELSQIEEPFDFVQGLCEFSISVVETQADDGPVPEATTEDQGAEATSATTTTPGETAPQPLAAPRPPDAGTPQGAKGAAQSTPAAPTTPKRDSRSADDDADGRVPKPTLRVDLERVERLINAVGELIINQAMIEQSILDLSLASDAEVITHVEDYRLLARDLQEAVMAIRAQPVKPLFQRMSRILREAAEATGKSARLVTVGETTEVDKTVIERLADPLTHMIRNALDHGLEPRDARIAAGKDPEGTIRLSAAHRSGSVLITIRDDGAGLDRPRIRNKAILRGLIAADAELSDAEIDNLLFLPGFSTAEKISNLSGRGVGLDVVRNAVSALGGRIAITSHPGEGTEFAISLPLTLAVMDGMVISVSGQTMVIPIASVVETVRPLPSDLHTLGTNENLLSMRGHFLPMIDVAQCLGFPERDPGKVPLLLLVETEQQSQCALIVDSVLDQRQVVIKGLDSNYGAVPGVSAATVLGDGQIALILDAEALTTGRHAIGHPQSRGSTAAMGTTQVLNAASGVSHAIH